MACNKSTEEMRHYCRNPHCRAKLTAPVSNPRDAFCTRGCYQSFYLHRCFVCEGPIQQPKRGRRLICKKAKCRNAWRANSGFGRYHPSPDAKLISKEANFAGAKEPLKPDRLWHILAGPEMSGSAFHCAVVRVEEAVEAINRTNFKRWREANAKAEEKTLIKRHHPPVNVLGGYKHPGASFVDLAPSKVTTSEVRRAKAVFSDDPLDIPNFLRRTAPPLETPSAQKAPPQAAHVRKNRVKVAKTRAASNPLRDASRGFLAEG
jgi:hypothetical protein